MKSEIPKPPLYFIALMPPANIRSKVENFKKEIKTKYGVKHALKLPAHITLQIPFRMWTTKEEILVKKLKKFAAYCNSFTTELNGFGKFSKNVIFIQVKDHKPFIELHAKLQHLMLNFLELQSHEISTKIHPHITLATRDLKRSHFPEIWEDFKDKEYNASFKTENLYLLKHNGKTWDILKKFQFSS